jgi:flagellar protein FliJ
VRPSKQLKLVKRVTDDEERRCAESLAARERRVAESEAKLAELERYHLGYAGEFGKHVARGIDGARIREFQAFLSRLSEAMRQQGEILERARADRDLERSSWRRAAQRAEMVDHVVKRREQQERRAVEREEQRESDERSLRKLHRHEQ